MHNRPIIIIGKSGSGKTTVTNSESEINYKTRLVQERIEFDNIESECDLVINCDTISIETVAELIHNYCFDNLY